MPRGISKRAAVVAVAVYMFAALFFLITAPVVRAESVTADDFGIEEPTLLPTSNFYFLKDVTRGIQKFFTFNPVKKIDLELKFADEKILEAKKIVETSPNAEAAIGKAIGNYSASQEELKVRLKKLEATSQNPNIDKLLEKIVDRAVKHEQLFFELKQQLENHPDAQKNLDTTKETLEDFVSKAATKDTISGFAQKLGAAFGNNSVDDATVAQLREVTDRLLQKATVAVVKNTPPAANLCKSQEDALFQLKDQFADNGITQQEFLVQTERAQKDLLTCYYPAPTLPAFLDAQDASSEPSASPPERPTSVQPASEYEEPCDVFMSQYKQRQRDWEHGYVRGAIDETTYKNGKAELEKQYQECWNNILDKYYVSPETLKAIREDLEKRRHPPPSKPCADLFQAAAEFNKKFKENKQAKNKEYEESVVEYRKKRYRLIREDGCELLPISHITSCEELKNRRTLWQADCDSGVYSDEACTDVGKVLHSQISRYCPEIYQEEREQHRQELQQQGASQENLAPESAGFNQSFIPAPLIQLTPSATPPAPPTAADIFNIASVKGYSSTPVRGEIWPLAIHVREPDNTAATPKDGFSVQVYIVIPKVKTLFGGNAEFNGSTWDLTVNVPKEDGSYRLSVYAYCGLENSACEKLYGRARQVEWNFDFTFGTPVAVPPPPTKKAPAGSLPVKSSMPVALSCDELNNALGNLKAQHVDGKITQEELDSKAKVYQDQLSSACFVPEASPAESVKPVTSLRCDELSKLLQDLKTQYTEGKIDGGEFSAQVKPYEEEQSANCFIPAPMSPKPATSARCEELNNFLKDLKIQYSEGKLSEDEMNSRAKPYQDEQSLSCQTTGGGEQG